MQQLDLASRRRGIADDFVASLRSAASERPSGRCGNPAWRRKPIVGEGAELERRALSKTPTALAAAAANLAHANVMDDPVTAALLAVLDVRATVCSGLEAGPSKVSSITSGGCPATGAVAGELAGNSAAWPCRRSASHLVA